MRVLRLLFALVLCLLLGACARAKLPPPGEALRLSDTPELQDDLGLEDLRAAVNAHLQYLSGLPASFSLRFGERIVSHKEYLNALTQLAQTLSLAASDREALSWINEHFDFYQVYGDREWGDVFITGYFEPLIRGASAPTPHFSQPLYARPPDLLTLNLASLAPRFAQEKSLRVRVEGRSIAPYYSRHQIDAEQKLAGQGLELCWVDPVDAFFLQIQGSGSVELEHGRIMRLNYADKNGWPYVAIGAALKSAMQTEDVTALNLERYLRALTPAALRAALDLNPSYIFFKTSTQHATTSSGIAAIANRTIAVDADLFPKGALALLTFLKPVVSSATGTQLRFVPATRFVFDHDSGGAIKGPGRVDLFFGAGEQAKFGAGVMKGRGELYYLAPKQVE